jgi:hypothetical protein
LLAQTFLASYPIALTANGYDVATVGYPVALFARAHQDMRSKKHLESSPSSAGSFYAEQDYRED